MYIMNKWMNELIKKKNNNIAPFKITPPPPRELKKSYLLQGA